VRSLLSIFFVLIIFQLQAQTSTLNGTITGENNEAIPFVTIQVENFISLTADADGRFSIPGIKPGNYKIKFSAIGYETKTQNFTIAGNQEVSVTIQLIQDLQALNEVIITSNRREETLDEVPSSVSVLSSQQIRNLSQTSNTIADVLTEVPGLSLSTNQTSNTGQTLRGRNMLVLIDGIPQSTPLRNGSRDINTIDPNVIERIEVIKGATAIYGNGADGGIINYITKKPATAKNFESTSQLSAEGSLVDITHTAGTRISQTFSGRKEKLGYVASGSFRQTGIFRDANGEVVSPTYGLGETDQYNLFGKLNYELAQDHNVEFMYNYFSSNQDTEYINKPGVYLERPAIGVIGEVLGVDQGNRHNHNGQFTYDAQNLIGNTDMRLNLYFQDFQTVYGWSPTFNNPEEGFEGGQSTIESSKKGARVNFKTPYALGSQFSGDILYGVDLLNDITSQNLIDGRVWVPEVDMTNIAPYLQLKALYSDFVLKAGLRVENINIDIPDYSTIHTFANGVESGDVQVQGGELVYDATTFNVGARYNKFPLFKPFVSFSQSFSIADLGRTLRTATENTVSKISSEAVIANNYEAGFTSQLGNTRLSGAYFISTSQLGATYREVNGIFEIARQPEKVYGFEVALDSRLGNRIFLGSSVSYTEGKLDAEDSGEYNLFMNGDRIPPLKIVNYIQYRMTDKFAARLAHIYSGNRNKFDPKANGSYTYAQGPVSSFNIFNLTTNYSLTPTTGIGMGVENLLNENYFTPISQWDARPQNYSKGNGARFNLSLTVNL